MVRTMARVRLRLVAIPLGLIAVCVACGRRERAADAAGAAASAMTEGWWQKTQSRAAAWKEVEKLEGEQKLEAAAAKVVEIREAAKKANDEPNWTRALVEEVRLRRALGGFETAVRLLREQPWPKSAMATLVLEIVYADALTRYVHDYSWEIRRRERVDAKGTVDLKAWTADQIVAEAQKAWQRVWARRAELGDESVAALGNIVNQNNYPKEVRGRLRDALSYLAVETLADTSLWTPEQSNETFRLDFDTLLRGNPSAAQNVKLDDPAAHPVTKIAAVLDDLEEWHKRRGRRDAALEAHLTRVEQLRRHFSKEAQLDATRAHVAELLPQYRGTEWWSMGVARLASWIRDDEGDQVRARKLALEGMTASPRSVGGQTCRTIVASIESPDFSIQGMTADGPGKRSFEVTHKNLGKLWFRAYAVDLLQRIESSKDYNLLPSYNEHDKLLASGKPVAAWSADLPSTPDYKHHRTFVTPPLRDKGLYVIVASAREDFREDKNRLAFTNFIVTDLVMVTRNDGAGGVELTVLRGSTGRAATGAEVAMYRYDWQRGHRRVGSRRVDADGLALFPFGAGEAQSHFFVALDDNGKDVALESSSYYFSRPSSPRDVFQALLYTDRSIYRPQQPLHWKVIAYRGRPDEAKLRTAGGEALTVRLRDANNQVVTEQKVKTNEWGSASGTFTLPTGRLLGQWHVETAPATGSAYVRVEEYKRPTFEVSFRDAKEPLRLNRPATVVGEAKYYFGLPVTTGRVRWRVVRSAVYPWYWYSWGWVDGGGAGGEQAIASGTSALEADGTFKVAFTPVADESAGKDLSWSYHVEADLTDEGGETRSASRDVRLGFTSVEASISVSGGVYLAGNSIDINIARTNLDAAPRPGKGRFRLVALKGPAAAMLPADLPRPPSELGYGRGKGKRNAPTAYTTPGDALRPRWAGDSPEQAMSRWPEGDEKKSGELTHDDKGQAVAALGALPPGVYRLKYTTQDDFGATYETFRDFVVGGQKASLPLALLTRLEQGTVKVGGTARLYVTTGLADQELFLDVYRNSKRVSRRRLAANETLVELPVREADRGGFGLVVTGARDHQILSSQHSVFVPWDDRQLEVAFSTFRDTLRPGAKETFRVTVKAPNGRAADSSTAELLAYMYDRSLDVFAPHHFPSPMALWPSRTGVPWARSSLGNTYAQTRDRNWIELPTPPSLHGDSLVVLSGYGIGGPGMRYRRGRGEEGAMGSPTAAAAPAAPPAEREEADNNDRGAAKKAEAKVSRNAVALLSGETIADERNDASEKKANAGDATTVRSNFAETAFFKPHLLLGKNGESAIEFQVPDSVTSWNVWVHAIARDLSSGSVHKEARSVKELMVRPYVPRFFREGDTAELKVVVNNAGKEAMKGTVTIAVLDAESRRDESKTFGLKELTREFVAEPGRGTNVTFPLAAPRKVGVYAFQVTAKAGQFSDGELRPLPVLPSRLHLMQSRFVTLRDGDKRTMTFDDLKKNDDPTRTDDQMVVTVDAQLFFTVLKALPYLIDYPYECTEQTLNRFVSTGIVTSLFDKYPSIAKMAAELAKRPTALERFDAADPNRKMALEESPWLQTAQGGADPGAPLIKVLDPKIAQATRDDAIAKLRKSQTSSGGWPWFPGGPPSPYMTLYLLHGFAKAAEFKVAVPKDLVQSGWRYVADHVRREDLQYAMQHDCCWEFLTFVNYVAGAYPDESWTGGALTAAERKQILDFSFKHWKQHSPMLKGYLALTLKRMGREADAKLVWASVMDSAKTAQDQGTFWAPEDRSWLWYNDTIESHAFALRTQMELDPRNAKNDGLVLWLLLNKKLNQWKSTRATAEVLYSLATYLEKEQALGVREQATVAIGPVVNTLTFEPDRYVGKSQIVIPGPEVKPEHATVTVEKKSKGVMFASATWHFSTDKLPAEERGDFFSVKRTYFKRDRDAKGNWVLTPLAEGAVLQPGDQLEVQVSLRTKHAAEYVHLRDPRGAGFEPESATSKWRYDLGLAYYEEVRDSGANFFFEQLPVGEYTFKYRVRANMAGTFRVGPATVQSMYAPEFSAYSAGNVLTIK